MDDKHGPPAPADAIEHEADQRTGLIITTAPSYTGVIEVGRAYVFVFIGREMSGVVTRARKGFVTLRTKSASYSVPVEDILRPKKT